MRGGAGEGEGKVVEQQKGALGNPCSSFSSFSLLLCTRRGFDKNFTLGSAVQTNIFVLIPKNRLHLRSSSYGAEESIPRNQFRICGINRLRFASFFQICGINRLRFASICQICGINRVRSASFFRICGINRLPFPSICPICGIHRVRSASIFRICGINSVRFASIFLRCRTSRVCFALIFTSAGISRFVLLRYRKRSQDRSFIPP